LLVSTIFGLSCTCWPLLPPCCQHKCTPPLLLLLLVVLAELQGPDFGFRVYSLGFGQLPVREVVANFSSAGIALSFLQCKLVSHLLLLPLPLLLLLHLLVAV
jgi:hypothetical protein